MYYLCASSDSSEYINCIIYTARHPLISIPLGEASIMNHSDSAAMRLFPIQREGWELSLYECPNCQGSIQAIVTDDRGTPTAYPCRHQLPAEFPE
jgi:hypothetical protein